MLCMRHKNAKIEQLTKMLGRDVRLNRYASFAQKDTLWGYMEVSLEHTNFNQVCTVQCDLGDICMTLNQGHEKIRPGGKLSNECTMALTFDQGHNTPMD